MRPCSRDRARRISPRETTWQEQTRWSGRGPRRARRSRAASSGTGPPLAISSRSVRASPSVAEQRRAAQRARRAARACGSARGASRARSPPRPVGSVSAACAGAEEVDARDLQRRRRHRAVERGRAGRRSPRPPRAPARAPAPTARRPCRGARRTRRPPRRRGRSRAGCRRPARRARPRGRRRGRARPRAGCRWRRRPGRRRSVVAVGERDAVGRCTRLRCGAQHSTSMPSARIAALEQPRGERVELQLHQAVGEVDDGDLDAALAQAARGLEPEQAAADHDGGAGAAPPRRGSRACRRASGTRTRRALEPGDRRQPRRGAGGEHERRRRRASRRRRARPRVARVSIARAAGAEPQRRRRSGARSASRSSADVARERLREQHAVVGRVRLAADERHLPASGSWASTASATAMPGHAGADDHERGGPPRDGDRRHAPARRAPRRPSAPAACEIGSTRARGHGVQRARARPPGAARPSGTARTRRRGGTASLTRSAQHRRPAARAHAHLLAVGERRRRRPGAARGTGAARRSSSDGDLPVRVIVCHCCATRPVVSTSGKSGVTASAGAGVRRRREPRAAVGRGEAARRRTAARCRGCVGRSGTATGSAPSRRSRACEMPVWSHSRPSVVLDVLGVHRRRRCATGTPRGARARGRRGRRSPSPAAPRRAGRARAGRGSRAARSSSSSRPSPATARRAGARARARRSRSGSTRPGR